MLRKLDIESVCALSGKEALAILRKNSDFKLVLTDLWMPEIDGAKLAEEMHQSPELAKLPVVAVTADAQVIGTSAAEFQSDSYKSFTINSLRDFFRHLTFRWAGKSDFRINPACDEVWCLATSFGSASTRKCYPYKNGSGMLDSTSIKVHPNGTGALKKAASKESAAREEVSPQNFIWSPPLTVRRFHSHSPLEMPAMARIVGTQSNYQVVRKMGVEPTPLSRPDPKSGASANFATRADRKASNYSPFSAACQAEMFKKSKVVRLLPASCLAEQ